jgi:hypothetical protein
MKSRRMKSRAMESRRSGHNGDVPDDAQPAPTERDQNAPEPEGGESACWLHLCCEECGTLEGEPHRPGCRAADQPRAAMYFA